MAAESSYQSVMLFGAPGVGKGTQGKILGCVPGFVHFSMGDAFRSLDPDSELGRTVAGYSSRGELVPDEVTVELWRTSVGEMIEAGAYTPMSDILILDGIPRNAGQVELLKEHIEPLAILHLMCADQEAEDQMVERLRRRAVNEGRADDAKPEVIRRRFEIYRAETQPVLERYPQQIVRTVDPVGTPAEILRRLLEHLAPIQQRHGGNPLGG